MSEEKKQSEKREPVEKGYKPLKDGYQPTEGNLDTSNPPQGGSGVSQSTSNSGEKPEEKE
jgi:hypothetical protein